MTNLTPELHELLSQAQQWLSEGLLNEAAEGFEVVLRQFPQNVSALVGAGRIALLLEQPSRAFQFAQRALEHDVLSLDASLLLALSQEQLQGVEAALATLLPLVPQGREHAPYCLETARLLQENQQPHEARPFVDQAVALHPTAAGHWLRAKVYRSLNGVAEALSSLEAAIALEPQEWPLYWELISLLTELDELDLALQWLVEAERCCQLSPSMIAGRQAGLWVLKGEWELAVQSLERLARSASLHPSVWRTLGVACLMNGDLERAEEALKQAVELAEDDWENWYALGNLYEACRLWDEAVDAFEQAGRHAPERWEPYNNLGLLFLQRAESGKAATLLKKAAALTESKSPIVLLNLTLAQLQNEQKREAQQTFQALKALGTWPDDVRETLEWLEKSGKLAGR